MQQIFKDLLRISKFRTFLLFLLAVIAALLEGSIFLTLMPFLRMLTGDTLSSIDGGESEYIFALLETMSVEVTESSLGALTLTVAFSRFIVYLGQHKLFADIQSIYTTLLRANIFHSLINTRWSYYIQKDTGEYSNAINLEVSRAVTALALFVTLITTSIILGIFICVSLFISWEMTLFYICCSFIIASITFLLIRKYKSVGENISTLGDSLNGWSTEVLNGLKIFKVSSSENIARDRYDQIIQDMENEYKKLYFTPPFLRGVMELSGIAVLVIALISGTKIFNLDISTQLIIIGVFVRTFPLLSTLQETFHTFRLQLPAIENVHTIINHAYAQQETLGNSNIHGLQNLQGPVDIDLEHLTIAYGDRVVLKDINLSIEPRQVVAIVGASGAGKTTLIDTLLGLITPTSGQMRINQNIINEGNIREWRTRVSYVAQDTILFNASIADNIALTLPSSTLEDIRRVSKLAHADEFIMAHKDGYERSVGNRGHLLSGGQKQRLAIARALLANSSLMILDEATSALDSKTEIGIMQTVYDLKDNVTTLIVAHRLSTIRHADKIVVLDHGEIAEQGTWEELMAQKGLFEKMWQIQQS